MGIWTSSRKLGSIEGQPLTSRITSGLPEKVQETPEYLHYVNFQQQGSVYCDGMRMSLTLSQSQCQSRCTYDFVLVVTALGRQIRLARSVVENLGCAHNLVDCSAAEKEDTPRS